MTEATTQTRYRVDGMDCAACATKIDKAVRRIPGVQDVTVSVTAGTMTVLHDRTGDLAAIEQRVTSLGYIVAALAGASSGRSGASGRDGDLATTIVTIPVATTGKRSVSMGTIATGPTVPGGKAARAC